MENHYVRRNHFIDCCNSYAYRSDTILASQQRMGVRAKRGDWTDINRTDSATSHGPIVDLT